MYAKLILTSRVAASTNWYNSGGDRFSPLFCFRVEYLQRNTLYTSLQANANSGMCTLNTGLNGTCTRIIVVKLQYYELTMPIAQLSSKTKNKLRTRTIVSSISSALRGCIGAIITRSKTDLSLRTKKCVRYFFQSVPP